MFSMHQAKQDNNFMKGTCQLNVKNKITIEALFGVKINEMAVGAPLCNLPRDRQHRCGRTFQILERSSNSKYILRG